MKQLLLSSAILLLCGLPAAAQEATPTPAPLAEDVVKISTNLIQIDVTVTDKKGNPVKDLRPDEIEVYENGKRQDVTAFSFVESGQRSVLKEPSAKGKDAGAILPPRPVRPENVRRTVALVVDDLTLSFGSANRVQHAVKKFVNEQMQDGDLVAIIRTGTGIGALQQFTTDKRQLLKAAEKIRFNMSGSARIGVFNPIDASLKAQTSDETSDSTDEIESDRDIEQEMNDFRESIFASGTLGAVNYVVRGMKELPGRKSVVLITDGLRLSLDKDRGTDRVLDLLRKLADLATRSSVVIYTVDARGLVAPFLSAEDNVAGMSSEQIDAAVEGRRQDLSDSQDGLRFLAYETGGTAFVNQNDISYGIRKVLDDQSYYLVGYEPDSATFDPKTARFNKLAVKVKRDDVRVRFRSGFFGVSEESLAATKKVSSSPLQKLYDALTSPFAENQVPVRLNALMTAAPDRTVNIRSLLHIDADKLSFTKGADGRFSTSFDIVISTFGDNGVPVEGQRTKFSFSVSDEGLATVKRTGLIHNFMVPVKKPGAYQLRVAIRDNTSDQVGSAYQFIEVPDLKKNRLTMSGVLLENVDYETWRTLDTMDAAQARRVINPLADTAIRQFKPGSVLTYTVNIYNPRTGKEQRLDLNVQASIYDEKELVFAAKPVAITLGGPAPVDGVPARGTMRFGSGFAAGNYTLQLTVTDNNVKGKRKVTTQFVPFEIVK
ncbi:MAG: VWA domain-containing protein [Chloracidobacterium sp.]|nr:VWA domain-containing protein [Chloracidobacterium sp.]